MASCTWVYETACRIQIGALSGGSEPDPISESTQEHTIAQGLKMDGEGGSIQPGREWPTLVRQLERLDGMEYRS